MRKVVWILWPFQYLFQEKNEVFGQVIVSNLSRLSHVEMQWVVPAHILCASHCDSPPTALFWSTGWMNEFFLVVIKALLVRPSRDIVSCLLAQGQSTWWVGADKTDRVLFALCWVYELIIWAHSALSRVPKETVGLCDSCIINHWLLFIQKSQISLV